ncbi:MAG: NrfD/PsrC family molybdoenzyme membrane anchor subunit [Thermodesulfobacteriota bacterium]
MSLKRLTYGVGCLLLVLGIYGFVTRLFVGERDVNCGSYVVWGLLVSMYLFFAGLSTGSYMMATLEYLFGIRLFKGTGKVCLWASLVTMPAALTTIGMDLGHMERIWRVYLMPNFGSLMAQMVWGYTLFIPVTLVSMYLVFRKPDSPWTKPFFAFGLLLAIWLSGGVGALLGVNASRLFWHVGLLPVQFPVFSLASGAAFLMLVLGWFSPKTNDDRIPHQLWVLGLATVGLTLIKVYFLWADFSQSIYGDVPDNVRAVNEVLYGTYWWVFWFLQIGLGTALPVIVLLQPRVAKNGGWAGAMGFLVLFGFAVARANIVLPALTVPELAGLVTAFTGPHLGFDYFPSLMEWSIVLGVTGGTTLAFLIGNDLLSYLGLYEETKS